MTSSKGTYRQRRKTTTSGIPKPIKEWFAGERRFTFYAHTWPYIGRLEAWWDAWLEEKTDSVMPQALPGLIKSAKATLRFMERK